MAEKQFIIRDNGVGIDQKDLPRIFDRGFTEMNGRAYMKSTGMGLYLAQELSNKLGHYITCTSEVGRHTEMVMRSPPVRRSHRLNNHAEHIVVGAIPNSNGDR